MRCLKSTCTILVILILLLHNNIKAMNSADSARVVSDFDTITKSGQYRNSENIAELNRVATYIYNELKQVCDTVFYQPYSADGKVYKNVVARVGVDTGEKLIVGAHYDVAGDQEGADDNASGVIGMLEIARLLKGTSLSKQIEFVAYTLEEPPYFGTKKMGSYIHAKSLNDSNQKIAGMICLEMIGYFTDEENSQSYPVPGLNLIYGNKGDFITVVQKTNNGTFGDKLYKAMKQHEIIKTKQFKATPKVTGLDFSDHRNYWKFGYSAVMITNTAYYRNPHYHNRSDKLETLDIGRMCKVIDELALAIKTLYQ